MSGGIFQSISQTINGITKAISDQKIAQINATSDVEKTKIQANIDQLQAQKDVLLSNNQAGIGWLDEALRIGFAAPFIVYLNKAVLWDKVIGKWPEFTTDPLSDALTYTLYAILGYLFVTLLKK